MVNTITFGGVTSSTYDIYISGEGVWSAPARDAGMVTIPGRNGAFVHDKERFENIEVTYPAFIVKDNNTNFRTKIDDFRNAMCAQVGYQKLVDTFHPSEYRMAALVDGMEIKPILYNDHAATFDITFNCKPQRFLISGDTAVAVADGGTITNPTLFDAKPQLQVKGYGVIGINGEEIEVENVPMGRITIKDKQDTVDSKLSTVFVIDVSNLNVGDTIEVDSVRFKTRAKRASGINITTAVISGIPTNCTADTRISSGDAYITIDTDTATFSAKGALQTFTATASYTLQFSDNTSYTSTQTATVTYNGSKNIILTVTDSESSAKYEINANGSSIRTPYVYGDSTKTATGNPAYIDLDIGEAWNEDGGEPVSIDNAVILPAKLPVLSPGVNTITYDNTVTSFKIVPRWWRI